MKKETKQAVFGFVLILFFGFILVNVYNEYKDKPSEEVSQEKADKYLRMLYLNEIQDLTIKGREYKTNFYATKADSLFLEMEKHFKNTDEYFEARRIIKQYKEDIKSF